MLTVAEAERYRQTLQQLQATQQRLGYRHLAKVGEVIERHKGMNQIALISKLNPITDNDWLIKEDDFPSPRLGLVLSTYRWKASEEALLQYLSLGGNLLMLDATIG